MNEKRIVQALLAWFARNARDLPWRRTRDPYAIWVSEIMLQQTQVKTVLPYWERWMHELPNIPALASASPEKLHKLWEGLGYYTRVRNLQKAARLVIAEHGGKFPEDHAQVLELPGIGPYTAGAICSIAFNQPKPILDGNVVRVLSRLFGVAGDPRRANTRARLWRRAEELVKLAAGQSLANARPASAFNQALMELGALVCTSRQTRCVVCPLAKHCVAYQEGRVQDLPRLVRRARATPRRFIAFVVQRRSRFLVRQRPPGIVNAHLWEFPNVEVMVDGSDADSAVRGVRCVRVSMSAPKDSLKAGHRTDALWRVARAGLGLMPRALQPLCTIKHSITRYRITLQVFRFIGPFASRSASAEGTWLSLSELRHLPFCSAHKRILRHLETEHPAMARLLDQRAPPLSVRRRYREPIQPL